MSAEAHVEHAPRRAPGSARLSNGGAGRAIHALLLAFPVALFTSTVATDITYLNTAEMQWTNFSAWLNAGGLVFGGAVLAWAAVEAVLARGRAGLTYLGVVAAMWVVGLINAFQHSRDAWSSVGAFGLALSIVSALLAMAAAWMLQTRPVWGREVLR